MEQRTRGTIVFDGREVRFAGPLYARRAGIETVFQTLALADDLDVPDNLFLGREKTLLDLGPFSILDYRGRREATLAGLEKTAVKIPNIGNTIRNMSGGQRQCVAIARTATFHPLEAHHHGRAEGRARGAGDRTGREHHPDARTAG